jgi:cyanophycinase-like exopeptidase
MTAAAQLIRLAGVTFGLALVSGAALPADAAASRCAVTSVSDGSFHDAPFHPQGPGLVLNGGGSYGKTSMRWMNQTIRGTGDQNADVVFLSAEKFDARVDPTKALRRVGGFNAVSSFYIPMCAAASTYADVVKAIDAAEGAYIDGGDQSNYLPWRGSAIARAVDRLYARGGVVGGVSAGLAVLGNYVYDAAASIARNTSTGSDDAVENPYEPRISLSGAIFHFPPLRNAITDTHLIARNRLGRMIVFMARLIGDGVVTARPPRILGVGVDEGSAIVIDRNGHGRVMGDDGDGRAYLVIGGTPTVIKRGKPLQYDHLQLTILTGRAPTFDFATWTSPNRPIPLRIDGRRSYYAPFNPYR